MLLCSGDSGGCGGRSNDRLICTARMRICAFSPTKAMMAQTTPRADAPVISAAITPTTVRDSGHQPIPPRWKRHRAVPPRESLSDLFDRPNEGHNDRQDQEHEVLDRRAGEHDEHDRDHSSGDDGPCEPAGPRKIVLLHPAPHSWRLGGYRPSDRSPKANLWSRAGGHAPAASPTSTAPSVPSSSQSIRSSAIVRTGDSRSATEGPCFPQEAV